MASSAETNIVVELEAKIDQFMSDFTRAGTHATATMQAVADGIGDSSNQIKSHMDEAADTAKSGGENFANGFINGLKLIGAALASEFLVKIKDAVDEAATYANKLSTLHIETGDSVSKIQEMQYAFASVGVSSENAGSMFAIFQSRLKAAASDTTGNNIFARIGLDAKKIQDLPLSKNLESVADKVRELGKNADKVDVARSLFGRGGFQLLPALNAGGAGLRALGSNVTEMGAAFDDVSQKKLANFDEKLLQLAMTSRVFFADFAVPFLDAITKIMEALQRFAGYIEKMSQQSKMNVVIATLGVAFLSLGEVIKLVTVAFGSFIPENVIGAMTAFSSLLGPLAVAALYFYTMWQTNFANFRTIVEDAVGAAVYTFHQLQDTWKDLGNSWTLYITPALQDLEKSLRPISRQLDDQILSIKDSDDAWTSFRIGLGNVVKWLGQYIESQIQFKKFWDQQWREIGALFMGVVEYIKGGLSNLILALALFLESVGDTARGIGEWIPWFNKLGDAANDNAAKVRKAADDMAASAAHLAASRAALLGPHDTSEADFRNHITRPYEPQTPKKVEPDNHGSGVEAPRQAKAKKPKDLSGELAKEDIERIKDQLKPLEDKLSDIELASKRIQTEFKKLGDVDTWAKFAVQQKLIAAETMNLSQKLAAETALYNGQANVIRQLTEHKARLHDPKLVREYNSAIDQQQKAEKTSLGAMETTKGEIYSKEFEYQKKSIEYHKIEAERNETLSSSFETRIAAADHFVTFLDKINAKLDDQRAALAKLNTLQKEFVDYQFRVANNVTDAKSADATNQKSMLQSQVITSTDVLAIRQRDLAAAALDVTIAEAAHEKTINELTKVNAELKIEQDRSIVNAASVRNAEEALTAAKTAETTASTGLTVAKQNETNLLNATTPAVDAVRSGLLSFATRTIPEVINAIKLMKENVNPLTAIFMSLFEKSSTFALIQKTLADIMSHIAEIFNALRPVIIILLGVLKGVVNVFLTFYNVLATILNLFGLHIQKIKMVNDQLDNLAGVSKPLIEIVHDLPTINEFNKGKIGDLKAAADAQNAQKTDDTINTGFEKNLSKLGQIFGVLLAIKTIVGLLGGHSIAQQLSGGGILGFIGNLFGRKKDPGLNESFGGWDDNSSPNASSVYGYGQDPTAGSIADTSAIQDGTDAQIEGTARTIDGTNATVEQTSSTNSLTSTIATYIPMLITLFGGSRSGTGGGLAGIFSAGATLFGAIFDKSGKNVGAKMTGEFVDAGMLIFKGLGKGGTASETLGGIGEAAGAAIGGPVGGAIGKIAGELLGSIFGPHWGPPANYPDRSDTVRYGQDTANLLGHAGANGQEFDQNPDLKNLFSGKTGIAEIETVLAKYGTASAAPPWLAPIFDQMKAIFGISASGSGVLKFGTHIGDQHIEGAEGTDKQIHLYTEIASALETFTKGLISAGDAANAAAQDLGTILKTSTNLDLAKLFGNGQVSAVNGGYMLNQGYIGAANTPPPGSANAANNNGVMPIGGGVGGIVGGLLPPPIINVSIGQYSGIGPGQLHTLVSDAMVSVQEDWARRELAARRTLSFVNGTGTN